jgi:hypothetical protein
MWIKKERLYGAKEEDLIRLAKFLKLEQNDAISINLSLPLNEFSTVFLVEEIFSRLNWKQKGYQ